MSGSSIVIVAFLLAIAAILAVFGQVILALPIVVIGIGVAGFVDFSRRRKQGRSLKEFRDEAQAEPVDFTDRDKETLASSE